jgi:hypothetical protein
MQIKLYNTKSERNRLTKVLNNEVTLIGNLERACDIVNPIIVLGYDATLATKNYVYIADYGRYYFISNIVFDDETMIIYMHCDVLMSFRADILASIARVIRSASNYDLMIVDNMIINKANTRTYQRKIGNGFTRANKYLVLIGG